jgi:hypothetical protein
MQFLDRYLDDLERRYPDSTRRDVDHGITSGDTMNEA